MISIERTAYVSATILACNIGGMKSAVKSIIKLIKRTELFCGNFFWGFYYCLTKPNNRKITCSGFLPRICWREIPTFSSGNYFKIKVRCLPADMEPA